MTTVQSTKASFRSRHGSVAFGALPTVSKRMQLNSTNRKNLSNRSSLGVEFSRDRSASLTAGNLKVKKSYSLPDGKIALRNERMSSTNDVMEDKRPKFRTARSLKAIDKRKELYRKFQLVAKMAIFCIREARKHILRNKTYDDIGPYISSLHFLEFEKDEDLLFDPTKFKANKQLRISEETKRILGKPWFERTPNEIRYAQIALRNIQAYAEYPVRMQKKIVEVGRYEKYEAKRVVVRQGHPASAFYFILSGSVVVLVYQGDTKVAKPVAYMKRGQTFGELAIISRTTRQSTVVAKEGLELLSLDIEDFHDIFMAGGVKNMTDPDHKEFLMSLSIFEKNWPLEKMTEHQDMCLFHYFKRGDVLIKDSHFSEWIVIVKSGSLSVLKKLKRVDAYNNMKKEEEELKLYKSEKQKRVERELRDKQRRYVLSDLGIPLRNPEDVELEQVFTVPQEQSQSSTSKYFVRGLTSYSTEAFLNPHHKSISNLPQLSHQGKVRPRTSFNAGDINKPLLPRIEKTGDRKMESMNSEHGGFDTKTHRDSGKPDKLSRETSKTSFKTETNSKAKKTGDFQEEDEILDELYEKKNDIRTITQDLDSNFNKKKITILGYDPDDITVADLDPQFVHIQTLTKGQVFGVAEIVLGPQPSFCVVSNGAECIMLNRSFYLQYASEALLRQLRQQCSPYPSDEDMQMKLKVTVDWDAFRNSTFQKTLHKLSGYKFLKKYTL